MSAPPPDAAPRDAAQHGAARACPICRKPQDARFRPFCSRRCADVDLGRWLKGGYAIPAEEGGAPAEGPPGDPE
ncbi:MAG TPA: DNA gyrase inhibitor YacG [Rhizomicrobium sp.]|nr:DNA gyrase inhibitor YacG [Rhizomicrobium sp.]